jgi:hypothetical protein
MAPEQIPKHAVLVVGQQGALRLKAMCKIPGLTFHPRTSADSGFVHTAIGRDVPFCPTAVHITATEALIWLALTEGLTCPALSLTGLTQLH